MEDALKRLDKLTQEEVRMAVAEILKATHTVDKRVRAVANTVVAVDNRVARATHAIGERVLAVGNRVGSVNDKVAEVIRGAQIISVKLLKP
jgi:2-keto-3-deoxy-L-rhamnonate aldolase RhmA